MISGFRRELAENCALLGYYEASYKRFGTTYRSLLQGSRIQEKTALDR